MDIANPPCRPLPRFPRGRQGRGAATSSAESAIRTTLETPTSMKRRMSFVAIDRGTAGSPVTSDTASRKIESIARGTLER